MNEIIFALIFIAFLFGILPITVGLIGYKSDNKLRKICSILLYTFGVGWLGYLLRCILD